MPTWVVALPERLDVFLASEDRMPSRAKAQDAITQGLVKVNGIAATKPSMRLQEGDAVECAAVERETDVAFTPTDLHLSLLHEDDACFVIDKPAGYAVHPGAGMPPGEITILHGIAFLFQKRKIPFSPDGVLVHRLDKDTTGCLLVAKTFDAHRTLQEQFETRTVDKRYLAIVAGAPEQATAMIDAPIGRSASNKTMMTVMTSAKTREAQTTYRVLAAANRASLLECTLHTGRTHQVRVHLSSIGHPVLGDGTYRNDLSERLATDFDIPSLCLHAWKLGFVSPDGGKPCAITAPLPPDFRRTLGKLGIGEEVLRST